MGGHRRLRLYSRKNYERKRRQKRSFFGFPPSAIVRANTSYNLGTTFFQVGTASLTFNLPQGIYASHVSLSLGLGLFHIQIGNVN